RSQSGTLSYARCVLLSAHMGPDPGGNFADLADYIYRRNTTQGMNAVTVRSRFSARRDRRGEISSARECSDSTSNTGIRAEGAGRRPFMSGTRRSKLGIG